MRIYRLGTLAYQFDLPVQSYVLNQIPRKNAQRAYEMAREATSAMIAGGTFAGYELVEVYPGRSQPVTIGVLDALGAGAIRHCLMWHNALISSELNQDVYERVWRQS